MTTRPPLPPVDDDPTTRGVAAPHYDDRKDHLHMHATLNDADRDRLEAVYDGTRPLGAGERRRWERTVDWYGEGDRALIDSVLNPPAKPPSRRVAAALAQRGYSTDH